MNKLHFRLFIILTSFFILSACGGGKSTSVSKEQQPATTDAMIMMSLNTDLSNSKAMADVVTKGTVHIFFQEGSDWATRGVKRVDFYCCESSTTEHKKHLSDTTSPYGIDVDLSKYQDGNYELYAEVFFNDQDTPTSYFVNFNIDNSTSPAPSTNNQPIISGKPTASIGENEIYSFIPSANDVDNDSLTFKIANKPSWATFNVSTGHLAGTPSNTDVGTYANIIISVTDGVDTASLSPFNIQVINSGVVMVSSTPDLSNAHILEGSTAQGYVYMFFKEGGDWSTRGVKKVSFYCCKNSSASHTSFPSDITSPYGISVDLSQYQNGSYELYVDVFFNDQPSPVPFYVNFKIDNSSLPVPPTNNSPTVSGSPISSVVENSTYSFVPTANDIDGDMLSFNIVNKPSWATFNSSTGLLTGTPANSDIGIYSNIIISVSDSVDTASLAPFNIEVMKVIVAPTNNSPTVSGNPASSVIENSAYSFTPTATDIDGDLLTFSIVNKPSWATFNTSTGLLSGTPSNIDIGVYSNITISVTDGTDTANLTPFDINVTSQPAPSIGSLTLSWMPPTTYTDGSTLTNLAGFKIYYGTAPGNYSNVIDVPNPGITTYVVENMPGNKTYYIAVTAYDANGIESAYSSSVSKFIP